MAQKDEVLYTESDRYRTRLAQVLGTNKTWQLHEKNPVTGDYELLTQRIDTTGAVTIGTMDTTLKTQIVLGTFVGYYVINGETWRVRLIQNQSNNNTRLWQAHVYRGGQWVFQTQLSEAALATLATIANTLLGV